MARPEASHFFLPLRACYKDFSAMATASKCKVALLQLLSGADKAANVTAAVAAIANAALTNKADIIVLPECFNSPYSTASFPVYAEHIPSKRALIEPALHPTTSALSNAALEHRVYLVGGLLRQGHSWRFLR